MTRAGRRVILASAIGLVSVIICCCGASCVISWTPQSTPNVEPSPVMSDITASPSASPLEPDVDPIDPVDPGSVYYANCAEVRAAGAAPLHIWEPGYRKGLDRDGDGMACDR